MAMDTTLDQQQMNSNEGGGGFEFRLNLHGSDLLKGLQELRQSQQFTDVTLQVRHIL